MAIKENDTVVELTMIRKAIARAMVTSKTEIVPTSLTFFFDVKNLVAYRNEVKDAVLSPHNLKLSFLPFIVKAVATAVKTYPLFNAQYEKSPEDTPTQLKGKLVLKGDVNFGIAIDVPQKGLMVPNIKGADKLSVLELGHKIVELAEKSRAGKLTMADMSQGTITLSNFGSIGAYWGVPVINYPEVAIVAPGVIENDRLPFTIAADHRFIDGADLGRFAKAIAEQLKTLDGLKVL